MIAFGSPSAGSYRWVILAVVFLSQLSTALASQSIGPLGPILQSEMGLSKTQFGLLSGASFAGTSVTLILAGVLTDRHGVRRLTSIGQLVIAAFMIVMGFVTSLPQALIVMLAAGMGAGLILPGISKAVSDWFPRTSRGLAMGLKQCAVTVGGMITAATLPFAALALGWRPALALVGAWIIGAAVISAIFCRDAQRPAHSFDKQPSLRAGIRVVARNRMLWASSTVSLLYVAAQLALWTYLPLFLNEVVLVDAIPDGRMRIIAAGGYLALCQVGGTFGRIFWGVVSDRLFHGRRMVVMAIIGALSALTSVMVANLGSSSPLWLLSVIVFLYGGCVSGWNGLFIATLTESVDRRYAGTGVGLGLTIMQLGTAGGPPLFGFIVDTAGSFKIGWLIMGLFCSVGVVVSMLSSIREKGVA